MNCFIRILLMSSLLFSCQKEGVRSENIVGKWELTKIYDDFSGETYVSPNYDGKCYYQKDCFVFTVMGNFSSTIYGSDCLDSILEFGSWNIKGRQLEVVINENNHVMLADIYEISIDYLVLKTRTNNNETRIWQFERKPLYY